MGKYAVAPEITAVASKPEVAIASDGNVLPEICLIGIVSTSAPDDHFFDFTLEEITTLGTSGTALTIDKCGPAAAAGCTAKKATWSADPTITSGSRLGLGLYRRGKTQFQFEYGCGIKPAALAANRGLEIYCNAVGTASVLFRHTLHWYE